MLFGSILTGFFAIVLLPARLGLGRFADDVFPRRGVLFAFAFGLLFAFAFEAFALFFALATRFVLGLGFGFGLDFAAVPRAFALGCAFRSGIGDLGCASCAGYQNSIEGQTSNRKHQGKKTQKKCNVRQ